MDTHSEIIKLKRYLKRAPSGPEAITALQSRLDIELADPEKDPLTAQVLKGYGKVAKLLEEPFSLLDCGCMCGYFYAYLKERFADFTYTGVDHWPEAIEVARTNFPVEFICADFMNFEFQVHDYVLLSNLAASRHWHVVGVRKMSSYARKAVIIVYPNSEISVIGQATS